MLGLGLLGRGLNDAKFLAECGAGLTITDLKTQEQLKPTLDKLKKYKSIKYVLGKHQLKDFQKTDFVLKSAGVPLDSVYIEEAKKNNILVEMDESLFCKIVNSNLSSSRMRGSRESELDSRLHGNDRGEVCVVGVTGTRGKTTTTYLIYELLKKAFGSKVYLGGNIKGLATLPLIKKIKAGDIVVMELSSWQLQGFGDAGISPHISVFTNLMDDHLNYYKGSVERYFDDKKLIYKNQKPEDFLIIGESMEGKIGKVNSKKLIAKKDSIPEDWDLKIKGEHNLENISCAVSVARIFGIDEKIIKKVVCNFTGVEGRQEFLRVYKGVKIYNDTTATTPDATIVALKSLGDKTGKNVVLIMGGADKTLDMSELINEIPKYCKKVILLAGTGTEKVKGKIDGTVIESLSNAVLEALKGVKKGDILLFSPAFASFGMFKNEFDRGEQFVKIIKKLK